MIEKNSLSLDTYFFPGDGAFDDETLVKQASLASGTRQYIHEEMNPDPNGLVVVVNGMGASEYWGPNVNGDWFGESALTGRQTESEALKNPGDACGERLKRYKTFRNGHVFEHHQNDDPENSIGDILESFWHPKMHRVEIVTFVTDEQGKNKIIRKRKKGKPMPVSMGCRVPEDYCSICGNAAPSTKDYCDHLSKKMGEVLGDGRKVYAINKQPRFFDLSHVTVPADKTAYALKYIEPDSKKGASTQEYFNDDSAGIDKAASDKDSSIDKEVEPQGGSDQRMIKPDELKRIIGQDPMEIVGSLAAAGVFPKEAELQWFSIGRFNKEAALKACENKILYQTPDNFDFDSDTLRDRLKESSVNDTIIFDLEDYIRDNSVYSSTKEAQAVISPEPAPLPDMKNVDSESERAALRGTAGITGGAILGSLLDKLMGALKKGDQKMVKKILRTNPMLKLMLMSVLGAGASASVLSSDQPEQMIGRT